MIDQDTQETQPVLQIKGLSRRFGPKTALDDVSLTVNRGTVFGLVGENGAGKTTLIKHILGLLRAQQGTVRVFGKDPVAEPVNVLSRIGYLSEESDLPGWMRVHELLRYSQALYKDWDENYAEKLRQDFALDPTAKVKDLSKGQRARVGLLVALAYRPDLLLLDEPSSGLDPIVRRDILGAIIRTIADEGRTVIFSSHLLSEVERVSDYVAMVSGGKIIFYDTLERIKETHFKAVFEFESKRLEAPSLTGALVWDGSGKEWSALCEGQPVDFETRAAEIGAHMISHNSASLEEIFIARVGARIAAAIED